MPEKLENLNEMTDEKAPPPPGGSYQNLDAEKILRRLGKYGTYQARIIFVYCPSIHFR